ncbi:hypothetical protein [Dokdonia pacifica]|uniref:Uncharacterized protein n=1 Tax=Dokdonia pacifica TaxID=1627892 RepID=A0A238W860_9FLAO|nr:hypothetical protein [Dokdonia pacifica]SNR42607.1 hypothetical protein SAMN06265376_101782 [Dokdonia pacifica]
MGLDAIFSFFSSNPKGWNENFYYSPFRVGKKVVEIESNVQRVHNSISKYNAGCIRFRESEVYIEPAEMQKRILEE